MKSQTDNISPEAKTSKGIAYDSRWMIISAIALTLFLFCLEGTSEMYLRLIAGQSLLPLQNESASSGDEACERYFSARIPFDPTVKEPRPLLFRKKERSSQTQSPVTPCTDPDSCCPAPRIPGWRARSPLRSDAHEDASPFPPFSPDPGEQCAPSAHFPSC